MPKATPFKDLHNRTLIRLSVITFIVAISVFVVSLFVPVFITQTQVIPGYWILAMGWLGFIAFQFAWYAFPFSILSLYVAKKSLQMGLFLSIIAILMASEAFLFTEVPMGSKDRVIDYGLGFYLWYSYFYLVSFSILLRLVAWGSVEVIEENNRHKLNTSPILPVEQDEKEKQELPLSTVSRSEVRVTRKIDPKRAKPVGATVKKSNPWLYRDSMPSSFSRKNIYKKKQEIKVSPPPLPKKRWATPPPLPVSNLKIAPFLEEK